LPASASAWRTQLGRALGCRPRSRDLRDRAAGLEDETSAAFEQLRRVLPRSCHVALRGSASLRGV
jgi:hypothetical protein